MEQGEIPTRPLQLLLRHLVSIWPHLLSPTGKNSVIEELHFWFYTLERHAQVPWDRREWGVW